MILADGGTMSILPVARQIVARRDQARGHHRWEGISSPPGPGSAQGIALDELSLVDVAPLLLHQLGLPVPDDIAGRLPAAIFERRRARAAAAADGRGRRGAGRPRGLGRGPRRSTRAEQAALMDRLRGTRVRRMTRMRREALSLMPKVVLRSGVRLHYQQVG